MGDKDGGVDDRKIIGTCGTVRARKVQGQGGRPEDGDDGSVVHVGGNGRDDARGRFAVNLHYRDTINNDGDCPER